MHLNSFFKIKISLFCCIFQKEIISLRNTRNCLYVMTNARSKVVLSFQTFILNNVFNRTEALSRYYINFQFYLINSVQLFCKLFNSISVICYLAECMSILSVHTHRLSYNLICPIIYRRPILSACSHRGHQANKVPVFRENCLTSINKKCKSCLCASQCCILPLH